MASPPTAEVGAKRVIGDRFAVTRLLGEGAFAHVYHARDLTSGDEVAVKVLKEALRSDAEIVERFRREVFAVASVDSPHVVRMRDFGTSGDEFFIAMEYVEGPVLRDLLVGRPLSPDTAHVIVGQIAQAVAAAHDKGIIHRDLKPENVVLVRGTRGRQVKVLDFGLAKIVELEQKLELAPLTKEGMCFGTPQYMSPEQIQGRSAEMSADLWAVAVMAYEMLAGVLPWDGREERDVFYAVLGQPLPRITTAHRSLARLDEVNAFFAKALSLRASERPSSSSALFGAFEQALFGGPHAPAATVFSGVISAEFALPVVDGMARTEPGDAATAAPGSKAPDLAVTPDSTLPGKRVSSGKSRLHSSWQTPVVAELPPLSETAPGEPARLPSLPGATAAPANLAVRPAATAPSGVPIFDDSAANPPPAPAARETASAARDAAPTTAAAAKKGAGVPTWIWIAIALVVAASTIGYLLGRSPR